MLTFFALMTTPIAHWVTNCRYEIHPILIITLLLPFYRVIKKELTAFRFKLAA